MSEAKRKRFYAALQSKVGLVVGEENVTDNQIRALFRLPELQMRQWLVVMKHLFRQERQASWNLDISKKYFLMGEEVVQGWRIILRSEKIDEALDQIVSIVSGAPNAVFQVDQVPLQGRAVGDRNAVNARGKGATPIGGGGVGVPPIASMFGR